MNSDHQNLKKLMNKKLKKIFSLSILIFVFLVLYIIFLIVTKGNSYFKRIKIQKDNSYSVLHAKRGNIEDRNGIVLAYSKKTYNLILNVKNFKKNKIHLVLKILNSILDSDISSKKLKNQLKKNKNNTYFVLKKHISYKKYLECKKYINSNKYLKNSKVIWLEDKYTRIYPSKTLASKVIGYVKDDNNIGGLGLELYYNDVLSGTDGKIFKYFNYAKNKDVFKDTTAYENGKNIVLTIDANIQSIVENSILNFEKDNFNKNKKNNFRSKNIGVIIANPKNGEILAMACNHNYDLNEPYNLDKYYSKSYLKKITNIEKNALLWNLNINPCVSFGFEPGSTMKPITVAASLETNIIDKNYSIYCGGGLKVDNFFIKCHNGIGHGKVNLEQSLAYSCNTALMNIGLKLGKDKLLRYQKEFNIGDQLGIDLPYEAVGILKNKNITKSDIATNAFGQNFICSMLNILTSYFAISNNGYIYKPHLLKAIRTDEGEVITDVDKCLIKKPISENTSNYIKEILKNTVEYGTASLIKNSKYTMGGKTGTAEKIPRNRNKYVLSFIGFVPVSDPKMVIYVLIDEPECANQTSYYAVKLASDIINKSFDYINYRLK